MNATHQPEILHTIRLGPLIVSTEGCTITAEDNETRVSPRSMDVLCYLIEHSERVISAEELLERFWSSIASDHAVHKAIAELRAAMGDSVRQQRHIKTVPRRGYKLLTPVLADVPEEPPATISVATALRQRFAWLNWRVAILCCTASLMLAGLGASAERLRGTNSSGLVLDMAPLCVDSIDADGNRYLLVVSLIQTNDGIHGHSERFHLQRSEALGDVLDTQGVMPCDITRILAAHASRRVEGGG